MLTDAECKNATCPQEKPRARLACSGGLYLEISPAGSKRWFWKYRKDGKEGRMALGSYPDVGPKDARKARDAARLQKSEGRDPVQVRQIEKLKALTPAGDTFKATAEEWYAMKLDSWSSHYAIREKRNLEKDLFPFFGQRHIGEIEAIELLAVVRRVEAWRTGCRTPGIDNCGAGLALCGSNRKGSPGRERGYQRRVEATPRETFCCHYRPGEVGRTDPCDPWLSRRPHCQGGSATGTDTVPATG